jgi:hypothetical protein
MATKTKRAELEERKANEEQALRDLEAQAASKAAAIQALEEMAAADLAAVAVGDLGRESKKQANAKLEADALRIEKRELDRRIEAQNKSLVETAADMLAQDRADVAIAGGALLPELTADIAALSAKLLLLKELGDKHASLDARIQRIPGYSGSRIASAGNYEALIGPLKSFADNERVRKQREAAVAK